MAFYITEHCEACGACMDVCPVSAIQEVKGKYRIDPDACLECCTCMANCPADAIEDDAADAEDSWC